MRNTIILTAILFVAVIVASVYYFASLNSDEQAKAQLYEQLPDDAVWIAAFQNDELLDNVLDGFPIFKAILGHEAVRKLNRIKHDLLDDGSFGSMPPGNDLLLSIHPATNDSLNYLLSLRFSDIVTTDRLYKTIQSNQTGFEVAWSDSTTHTHFACSVPGFSTPLFVTVANGVTMASPSLALIERVAHTDYPTLPTEAIDYFVAASEEASLLKLHIVQQNLAPFAQHLITGKSGSYLALLDSLTGHASLHMNYKSDALIFSGFSNIDTDGHYLSLFASQRPVAQQIKHLFPSNTATYLSFGISDFDRFHDGNLALLNDANRLSQMHDQHRIIQERNGVSIHDDLLPQWGDEFAIVELSTRENMAIIKLRDTMAFMQVVEPISTPYGDNIYRFNNSNLLHYSFGDILQSFTRPYFMVIQDYVVCANHTSTLRQFANNISLGITLASTPGYRAFDELQGNSSNMSFFVHTENASQIVSGKLSSQFAKAYRDTSRFGYGDFYAWSIQLSGNGHDFFTNLYAPFVDSETPGATPSWTYDLNGRLAATPTVLAYDDTSRFILAQASNHILHALDFQGNRLWNAQLPERILGDPQQLSDSSIVLNTASRLYRFDKDGDPLPGFSLELPTTATSGLEILERNNMIRVFVPTANNFLVYDGAGSLLSDWENKIPDDAVLSGITTAATNDSSAIIVATDKHLYYFNEQGQVLREHPLHTGASGKPVAAAWESHSLLALLSDTLGHTHVYPLSGESTPLAVTLHDDTHRLLASNVAGDTQQELVYVEPRSVTVYQYPDSAYTFRYEVGQDIDLDRVRFFDVSQNHQGIGIPTPANDLIYLLKGDGTLMEGFPREGGPYFYYGQPSRGNPAFLITSKNDRRLYFFQW